MVLQHAVRYHEARDWIRQQDQSQLTYQALLSHCKMLEARCEQYQKAKERGHADLASITAAMSSLHIDAMSKSQSCIKCGYSHPNGKCPAKGQQCYVCNGFNHYTALCQKKGCRQPRQKQQRGFKPNKCSSSRGRHASRSPHRHRGRNHRSRSHSRTPSHSPSCSPTRGTYPEHSTHSKKCSNSHRYYQDSIDVIPADSITTGSRAEGMLFTERASDGQVAFYTRLDLPARSGTKTMVVKIDPGAQVNTIPLSKYCKLYPNRISKSRYPKAKSLQPTNHTWMSHDGLPKPFLGHFVTEVSHTKESRTYPIRFYVFEDATNPPCLLSYATSERLGIVQFQVPNLAATIPLDQVAVQTPGSKRKTAKKVTFQDPICEIEGSHTCSNHPDDHGGKRKTTVLDKGEETRSSYLSKTSSAEDTPKSTAYKTISATTKVKVGQGISNHFKTIPLPKAPNSPASKTIRCSTPAISPTPGVTKSILHCPEVQSPPVTPPHNISQVWDIMVLKRAFPDSFDTIGNMPGTYTIRTDPSVPPVQHARQKVPIEYRDQIEKALDDMVLKGVIAPVTKPTTWVSSLTYPRKPDGSLRICLDPKDLNKAIVQEHYKAPTLDEITHHLSGATCFSKLDAKDGFWSIHLDEDSSYLTTFNTHRGRYRFLHMPFDLKMSQDVFQM